MRIQPKYLTAALCALALTAGFSLTALAQNWCETCHWQCYEGYSACVANGQWTEYQCRQSFLGCIIYECDNCVIP